MNKPTLKKCYVLFTSICFFILHIPFVFAKNKPVNEIKSTPEKNQSGVLHDSLLTIAKTTFHSTAFSIYDSMRLNLMGLSQQSFNYAIQGFNYLVETGKLVNDKVISIVDFSMPSSAKRLFVIDLEKCKVLFNTYVAHGMKSGTDMANDFSNIPESNKSSLGFYETLSTYVGHNGYSMRLQGLEPGINDNANNRAIVVHGAPYVSEGFIKSQGYLGRSWGCPALPQNLNKPIIDKIKNGSCLFIYSPDKSYLKKSKILNAAA